MIRDDSLCKNNYYSYLTIFAGVATLVLLSVRSVMPGFDPASLYIDDQWVAAMTKVGWFEALALKSQLPLGFLALCKVSKSIFPSSDWPLQVFPLFFYGSSIIAIVLLVFKLSRNVLFSLAAGGLLASNRMISLYAIRVKQYTLDVFSTIVLIFMFYSLLESKKTKDFLFVTILSILLSFFSFFSIFLSLPILIFSFYKLNNKKTLFPVRVDFLYIISGYFLFLILYYFFLLRHQVSVELVDFWRDFYLPYDNFDHFTFVFGTWLDKYTGILRPPFMAEVIFGVSFRVFLGILLAGGSIAMISLEGLRPIAICIFCLFFLVIIASLAQKLPLSGERTDIFLLAPSLLVILGFGLLRSDNIFYRYLINIFGGFLLVMSSYCLFKVNYSYFPPSRDKLTFEEFSQTLKPDDAVIIYPHSMWGLAYYGNLPFHLIENKIVGPKYIAEFIHEKIFIPTYYRTDGDRAQYYYQDTSMFQPGLNQFLSTIKPSQRLVVLMTHIGPPVNVLAQLIIDYGFHLMSVKSEPNGGFVLVYTPS